MSDAPEYTIADDYDPDGDRPSADSDPVASYLTYLEDKRLGAVGEMGFTLEDFKTYIRVAAAAVKAGLDIDRSLRPK